VGYIGELFKILVLLRGVMSFLT